jgi:hypothetical protein
VTPGGLARLDTVKSECDGWDDSLAVAFFVTLRAGGNDRKSSPVRAKG